MCPASTRPKNKCGSACAESVHDPISRYKKCGRACSQWVHDPSPAMRSEIARAAVRLPKQAVSPPRHTLLPPGCTRTAVLSFRAPGFGPDTWWILPQCPPATLNINVGDPDLPAYLWQVRECVRVCVRVCVRACVRRACSQYTIQISCYKKCAISQSVHDQSIQSQKNLPRSRGGRGALPRDVHPVDGCHTTRQPQECVGLHTPLQLF